MWTPSRPCGLCCTAIVWRLSGSIFDAEDLLQETLLKGFGAIGAGLYHREGVPDARAYLCRIATNAWIDVQRKRIRAEKAMTHTKQNTQRAPPLTAAAGAALFERTSPQERAAVVLKDVFDFSLEEVASLLATSVGAVKMALRRSRGKLNKTRERVPAPRHALASAELLDRFMAAFAARDIAAVTATLLETVTYEVQGVGWEVGRKGDWITINIANQDVEGVPSERRELEGEPVLAGIYKSGRQGISRQPHPLGGSRGKDRARHQLFLLPGHAHRRGARLSSVPARLPSGRRNAEAHDRGMRVPRSDEPLA